jgi:Lar family restriction alleviation protein
MAKVVVQEKPCPFCGSTNLEPGGDEEDRCVQCTDCGAKGPTATIGDRDQDDNEVDLDAEAIALWNKRAPTTADLAVIRADLDDLDEAAMGMLREHRRLTGG